ncbi:MAG TPA: FtsX-like permease family protein [Vicinamibacteria bacterium]
MSPLAFAWRSLSRQPARALLGLTGVAVVGALLFDMLMLSRGLIVSFRDLLESTGFDVRVTATEALPGMGPAVSDAAATVEALRRLPELAAVLPVRFGVAAVEAGGGKTHELAIVGSETRRRGEWRLVQGEDLGEGAEGRPDMVVNRTFAREQGLAPGSIVRLASTLTAREFRVAGIVEFPFEAAGERMAGVTLDGFTRAFPAARRDEADLLLVASQPAMGTETAVSAIRRARPDLYAFSIDEVLERLRQAEFSYFRQVSFVLATIASFFALLLVTTLLTVSVNQRLGEVAALRALGFSRRRITFDLLAESALLVGGGGLAAVPLGLLLARGLDSILRQMPDLPSRLHFFVLEPRALALHLGFLVLAALIAAAYPVILAARLPIAATLRKESIS